LVVRFAGPFAGGNCLVQEQQSDIVDVVVEVVAALGRDQEIVVVVDPIERVAVGQVEREGVVVAEQQVVELHFDTLTGEDYHHLLPLNSDVS